MNNILKKILLGFRDLFALLRVTLTLQVGRAEVSKSQNKGSNEEDPERSQHDSKSNSL